MAERTVPKVIGYVMIGTQRHEVWANLPLVRFLNDMDNGPTNSLGKLASGIAEAQATADGIIAGTVPIDPTITGRGSLTDELDSTGVNIASTATAASAGALAASVSPTYAYGSGTPGTVTSNNVTVTASGGTGPYTYAWAKKSGGGTISATAATSATTAFYAVLAFGEARTHIWTCTVTDSLAATFAIDVPVNLVETTGA